MSKNQPQNPNPKWDEQKITPKAWPRFAACVVSHFQSVKSSPSVVTALPVICISVPHLAQAVSFGLDIQYIGPQPELGNCTNSA